MKAIFGVFWAIYFFLRSRFFFIYFAASRSFLYNSSIASYCYFSLSFRNFTWTFYILGLSASALRLFLLITVIKSSWIVSGACSCGTTTLHSSLPFSITLFDYLNSLILLFSDVLSGLSPFWGLSVCCYNILLAFKLVLLRFGIKFDSLPFFGGKRVVKGLLPAGRSPTL